MFLVKESIKPVGENIFIGIVYTHLNYHHRSWSDSWNWNERREKKIAGHAYLIKLDQTFVRSYNQ